MLNSSQPLTQDSTLGDLPTHAYQVNAETLGQEVYKLFETQPELPGLMLVEKSQLVGIISRKRFWEQMSQPYSLEIYLKRPIRLLLDVIKAQPLQLEARCDIGAAAQAALNRPEASVYEPIVVVYPSKEFRLLDVQVLLLAQSQVLVLVNRVIQQQKLEGDRVLKRLKQEQEKVRDYAQLLEKNQRADREQNQLLAAQQAELLEQSRQITQLNQGFVRIGQLLSLEGKIAFQATAEGVNAICSNTAQIVVAGKSLAHELETIHATSRLINKVSRQVRYLAIQAAVVANQTTHELSGFSQITAEIGKLVDQTSEASHQIDLVANRFKAKIQELTEFAHQGTVVARSLISKTERVEQALIQMEALSQSQQSCPLPGLPPQPDRANPLTPLEQTVKRTEAELLELQQLSNRSQPQGDPMKDRNPLIQKIAQVLKQQPSESAADQ